MVSNVAGLLVGAIETASQAIVNATEQILLRPEVKAQAIGPICNGIYSVLDDDTADMVWANISSVLHQPRSGLLSIGILVTIWVASGGMSMLYSVPSTELLGAGMCQRTVYLSTISASPSTFSVRARRLGFSAKTMLSSLSVWAWTDNRPCCARISRIVAISLTTDCTMARPSPVPCCLLV